MKPEREAKLARFRRELEMADAVESMIEKLATSIQDHRDAKARARTRDKDIETRHIMNMLFAQQGLRQMMEALDGHLETVNITSSQKIPPDQWTLIHSFVIKLGAHGQFFSDEGMFGIKITFFPTNGASS